MRRFITATIAGLIPVAALVFGLTGGPATGAFPPDRPNGVNDPCRTPKLAKNLLCPDLRIGKPSEMYLDRKAVPGRVVLRATNDIRSRGQGPMEVRGFRDQQFSMAVTQAIKRRAGGYALYPTQGRLRFFTVGYRWGGSYW